MSTQGLIDPVQVIEPPAAIGDPGLEQTFAQVTPHVSPRPVSVRFASVQVPPGGAVKLVDFDPSRIRTVLYAINVSGSGSNTLFLSDRIADVTTAGSAFSFLQAFLIPVVFNGGAVPLNILSGTALYAMNSDNAHSGFVSFYTESYSDA